jgi:hypothetical protein
VAAVDRLRQEPAWVDRQVTGIGENETGPAAAVLCNSMQWSHMNKMKKKMKGANGN